MREIKDASGRVFIWGLDMVGAELAIGDHVAFPNGSGSPGSMKRGVVTRLGDKMVVMQAISRSGSNGGVYRRYFPDVVRIPNV